MKYLLEAAATYDSQIRIIELKKKYPNRNISYPKPIVISVSDVINGIQQTSGEHHFIFSAGEFKALGKKDSVINGVYLWADEEDDELQGKILDEGYFKYKKNKNTQAWMKFKEIKFFKSNSILSVVIQKPKKPKKNSPIPVTITRSR